MLSNVIHRRGHVLLLKSCCYSSPVIESSSRATSVIVEPEAKSTELSLIAAAIENTEAEIKRVVAEIRKAEAEIRSATTHEDKAYFRDKASQLRTKEDKLRTEKEQLRTEKEQMRTKEEQMRTKEELEHTRGGCSHPTSLRLLHDCVPASAVLILFPVCCCMTVCLHVLCSFHFLRLLHVDVPASVEFIPFSTVVS